MSKENAEESASESIFEKTTEQTEEQTQTRCLARRVWWKVAIVLVLAAAVVSIIANKQRGNHSPARGAATQSGQERGMVAGEGTEENTLRPDTVLATVNGQQITLGELEKAFREMPEQYRTAFRNSQHELLEQLITRELLLQEARATNIAQAQEYRDAMGEHEAHPGHEEDVLIDVLLRREVFEKVRVTEDDLRRAYEELKDDLPDERSFEAVRDELRSYVRQEKQNKALEAYLAKLRDAATITRNEDWLKAQKARAADNPLDRALATGRPVVADFGRGKCIPCKMMKPILDDLKDEYAGRAEILIIEIDKYPTVTQRVGIRAIPTQIFYDAEGNEVYRHQGFMPRDAIVEKLREMGVER